jgi:hypothetical protein
MAGDVTGPAADPDEWQDLLPDPPSAEHYRELAESRGHPWPWPEPQPSDAPKVDR